MGLAPPSQPTPLSRLWIWLDRSALWVAILAMAANFWTACETRNAVRATQESLEQSARIEITRLTIEEMRRAITDCEAETGQRFPLGTVYIENAIASIRADDGQGSETAQSDLKNYLAADCELVIIFWPDIGLASNFDLPTTSTSP